MSSEGAPPPSRLSLVRGDRDPKADDQLMALRGEDLDTEERQRLGTTLSTDKGAVERAGVMTLAREIGSLPAPSSGLHAGHVIEALRQRRRRRIRWAVGLAAFTGVLTLSAITGLAAWGLQPAPWAGHHVTLEAQAVYNQDAQQIWGTAEIPANSTVHLTMTTTGAGALFVEERWGYGTVERIAPTSGRWEVQAGQHHIETGLRPAHSPLDVRYQAWFCPPGTDVPSRWTCKRDWVDVSWTR